VIREEPRRSLDRKRAGCFLASSGEGRKPENRPLLRFLTEGVDHLVRIDLRIGIASELMYSMMNCHVRHAKANREVPGKKMLHVLSRKEVVVTTID
jgi:hypothetical protein